MASWKSLWQSLKVRLSLSTLGICLLILWGVTLYSYNLVRQDTERLIGEQQFATAQLAANSINEAITRQFVVLEAAAAEIATNGLLQKPDRLQEWLLRQSVLLGQFNGAVFVAGTSGMPMGVEVAPVSRTP